MSKKILLIDDDGDEMDFLREALGEIRKPFVCFFASGVMEGMRIANTVQPDFIFLDINMPRMNGYEGLMLLKKSAQHEQIPVILYSTAVSDEVREKGARLGAAACIKKAASISALARLLNEFFEPMRQEAGA